MPASNMGMSLQAAQRLQTATVQCFALADSPAGRNCRQGHPPQPHHSSTDGCKAGARPPRKKTCGAQQQTLNRMFVGHLAGTGASSWPTCRLKLSGASLPSLIQPRVPPAQAAHRAPEQSRHGCCPRWHQQAVHSVWLSSETLTALSSRQRLLLGASSRVPVACLTPCPLPCRAPVPAWPGTIRACSQRCPQRT